MNKKFAEEENLHGSDDEGSSDESGVVTLTESNFKGLVTDSQADYMLEFYAPW